MIVHLVDGTYELFRHFYGLRRSTKGGDPPFGAVIGVLHTVLQMIETGATHIGVATDHVIESFRNDLWPGYKTGQGIEPALLAQFHPLEEALAGDGSGRLADGRAGGGRRAGLRGAYRRGRRGWWRRSASGRPDKDLAQCVRGRQGGAGGPPRPDRCAMRKACARSSGWRRR